MDEWFVLIGLICWCGVCIVGWSVPCRSGSSLMVGHSDRSGSFLCYSDVFCIE